MHFFGKLLMGVAITTLGGCILVYGYDDHDGQGSGAGANTGGSGGQAAGSSSGGVAAGGTGGFGGGDICTVPICTNLGAECMNAPCTDITWARRIGDIAENQAATTVALDTTGNVFIGGTFGAGSIHFGDNPVVDTGTYMTKTGFTAKLDASGVAQWVSTVAAGEIRAIGVDPAGNFVVTAALLDTPMETSVMVAQKLNMSTGIAELLEPGFGIQSGQVRPVAIDVRTDATYVLGTSSSEETVNCGGQIPLAAGMFVVKYDHVTLTCKWVKSFATSPVTNVHPAGIRAGTADIWITGSFISVLGSDLSGDQTPNMFVLQLDVANGTVLSKFKYGDDTLGGSIEPASIDVDTVNGKVFVAGQLIGPTELAELEKGQSAAFISALSLNDDSVSKIVFPGGTGIAGVARATGVVLTADTLNVSGTFSESIRLDPSLAPLEAPSIGGPPAPGDSTNTPFLAVIDPGTLKVLSFEYYPGYKEAYTNPSVFLAARGTNVVLAGGWRNTLDFSGMANGSNFLETPPSENSDIFVAKFLKVTP
jgi:hypothetical protein